MAQKYKKGGSFPVGAAQSVIVPGPGADQANRLFNVYALNTTANPVTIVLADNLGNTTDFVVPLNGKGDNFFFDHVPWETIANGLLAVSAAGTTVIAGIYAIDITLESTQGDHKPYLNAISEQTYMTEIADNPQYGEAKPVIILPE